MAEVVTKTTLKGGEFLIKDSQPADVYTREQMTEEQKMFTEMIKDWISTKVWPNTQKIEKQEGDIGVQLMREAGELGLLGASIPEQYSGMGMDFNTDSFISEAIGGAGSISVSIAAHTGIGTLPILYFGTDAQKQEWISDLASGKKFAAYCLTEPGSGSDALGAKTKAILNEEGTHYVLNGQKMWITNGGFADVFIVFAQIDGDKFTGFIIPKDTDGLTLGAEEDKLGIKGSSTRMVFLENAIVPKENVLGDIGKGHKIAFNVLNIGRYKLCAMALGGAKNVFKMAIDYAKEREQFGTSISNFGAIKYKIAEMATRLYATESATFRTSGYINDMIANLVAGGSSYVDAKLKAAEEYSIECAILKVLGSETLDYVVDENVQIHGGMGYSEEAGAARAYRDSRINRIFEGTNEINRLLSVGMLMKKGLKGEIDLLGPAMALQKELTSIPDFGSGDEDSGALAKEFKAIKNAKKAGLMVAGAAAQKYMQDLEKQQQLMMYLSDMLIDAFAVESTLLATQKEINAKGEAATEYKIAMAKLYTYDAMQKININGKNALASFAEGDELRMMLLGLKRFTKIDVLNTVELRRKIADKVVADGEYSF